MAVRNPSQVKAFVSVAGVTAPRKGVSIFDAARLPVIGRGFAAIVSLCVGERMIKNRLKQAFSPNEVFVTKELVDSRIPVYLQTKVILAIAYEKGAIRKDFKAIEPLFSKISKPLHFIYGDTDKGVQLAKAIEFRERFPATGLTVLKDTGHLVQYVHPEVVLSVIDSLNGGRIGGKRE
jgi:pimeloyl-ACP methyl ester carboxylesterase